MKAFLVVAMTLILNLTTDTNSIYGTWELVKIELEHETLYAQANRYKCSISEKMISFNLEINRCQSHISSLDDKQLIAEDAMCTEICCDGRSDSISNYINYSGLYQIAENQLVFTNKNAKVFLKRVSE